MLLQGLIENEKIDSFNIPFYAPSPEEVRHEIEKEGSFVVDRIEAIEIERDTGGPDNLKESRGNRMTKGIRAVTEPMLGNHFHFEPEMMNELFRRHAAIIDGGYFESRCKYITLVISVMKSV